MAEGTLNTATIPNEYELAEVTAAGSYVCYVDLSNMAAGDAVELRAYVKVLSTSSYKCVWYEKFEGDQPATDEVVPSIPFKVNYAGKCTLNQLTGSARDYEWSLTLT